MAYQKVTKGTTLATASAMQKALDGASIGLFKTVQGQQGNMDVLIMLAINIRSKTGLDGVTLYNCFMLATEEGKELATSGSDVETLLNNCEGRYIDFSSTGSLTIGSGASATTWQLYLSIDTIDPVNNTTITRATVPSQPGWTETIGVSMSARDSFAAQVMQGLVGRIAEPLRIEQSTWKYMTQLSYNIAEYMLVESVKRKAAAHDVDPDTSGSGGSGGEGSGSSDITRSDVSIDNLSDTDKLLNNISAVINEMTAALSLPMVTTGTGNAAVTRIRVNNNVEALPDIKVKNPQSGGNDIPLKVEITGGGGGGMTRANMNLVTAVYDLIVFSQSTDNVPSYVRFTKFLELLEALIRSTSSSILNWVTKKDGETPVDINSISTFLNAYASDIWSAIQSSSDDQGIININGSWKNDLKALVDAEIAAKVKAEALNNT